MVTVVVFEFSVMRCQPLRRALCFIGMFQYVRTDSRDKKTELTSSDLFAGIFCCNCFSWFAHNFYV
ncbi:hypothetical protein GU253_05745 [Vibrio cholerae]|nr:hypothetical protein [Vibrio paracholerae]